jgi:hypothetical protein
MTASIIVFCSYTDDYVQHAVITNAVSTVSVFYLSISSSGNVHMQFVLLSCYVLVYDCAVHVQVHAVGELRQYYDRISSSTDSAILSVCLCACMLTYQNEQA